MKIKGYIVRDTCMECYHRFEYKEYAQPIDYMCNIDGLINEFDNIRDVSSDDLNLMEERSVSSNGFCDSFKSETGDE